MCSQDALSFAITVYTMSITQWICQCKCISAMLQCSDEMGGFTFLFGIGRWFVKTSRIEPSEASNRVVRAQALSDFEDQFNAPLFFIQAPTSLPLLSRSIITNNSPNAKSSHQMGLI